MLVDGLHVVSCWVGYGGRRSGIMSSETEVGRSITRNAVRDWSCAGSDKLDSEQEEIKNTPPSSLCVRRSVKASMILRLAIAPSQEIIECFGYPLWLHWLKCCAVLHEG